MEKERNLGAEGLAHLSSTPVWEGINTFFLH